MFKVPLLEKLLYIVLLSGGMDFLLKSQMMYYNYFVMFKIRK